MNVQSDSSQNPHSSQCVHVLQQILGHAIIIVHPQNGRLAELGVGFRCILRLKMDRILVEIGRNGGDRCFEVCFGRFFAWPNGNLV